MRPRINLFAARIPIARRYSPGNVKRMAAANTADASMEHIGVKNTTINTEPGVQLYEGQRVIVGSVLDVRTMDTRYGGVWLC